MTLFTKIEISYFIEAIQHHLSTNGINCYTNVICVHNCDWLCDNKLYICSFSDYINLKIHNLHAQYVLKFDLTTYSYS